MNNLINFNFMLKYIKSLTLRPKGRNAFLPFGNPITCQPSVQIQRYLGRWATWWHCVIGLTQTELISSFVEQARGIDPGLAWLGEGLLLGRPAPSALN